MNKLFVGNEAKTEVALKVDVHELAKHLGLDIFRDNGYQIRCKCPLHGGSNPTAFSIDYDDARRTPPTWYCRTDCEASGDIYELIMRLYKIDFIEAFKWVAKFVGVDYGEIEDIGKVSSLSIHERDLADWNKMILNKRSHNRTTRHQDLNDEFVKRCIARRNYYFNKRGFDDELLDLFEVGFCPAGDSEWYDDRVTIPIRQYDGELYGISGRTMTGISGDKYMVMSGSDKKEVLYGLHLTQPYIQEKGVAILLEGFVDLWRCWQHGKRNAVAVMGKALTPEQQTLLLKNVHSVVIAFDSDMEGRMAAEGIVEQLHDFVTIYQIIPPYGKDVGDLKLEEFRKLCKMFKKRV